MRVWPATPRWGARLPVMRRRQTCLHVSRPPESAEGLGVRMEAVKMRAAHLVRRGWRATIFLALLAGLAGGVAMAAWAAGRRTATAFDRLLAYSDFSDLIVTICPPEVTELAPEALNACLSYDPVEERATISDLPEVESAARGAFRAITAAPAGAPDRTRMASAFVSADPGVPSVSGRPIVLEGRMYDPKLRTRSSSTRSSGTASTPGWVPR